MRAGAAGPRVGQAPSVLPLAPGRGTGEQQLSPGGTGVKPQTT